MICGISLRPYGVVVAFFIARFVKATSTLDNDGAILGDDLALVTGVECPLIPGVTLGEEYPLDDPLICFGACR
jgi:hypothetical protein